MKLLKKLLLAVVILCILFFISVFVLVRFQGKALFEQRASVVFQRPVTIEQVQFVVPSGLELTDLNIEGLLFAPKAQVSWDWMSILKTLSLSEVKLNAPVLTLHRGHDNRILWSEKQGHPQQSPSQEEQKSNTTGLTTTAVVQKLVVTGGKILFPSHEETDALDVSLQNVDLTASNVPLSGQAADVSFVIAANVVDGEHFLAESRLKGQGSLNWQERNMDADFVLEKLKGGMDVQVHMESLHNDMKVSGHVKTKPPAHDQTIDAQEPEDFLMAAMGKAGMTVEMNFSFPMKMDQWELRNLDFSGNLSAPQSEK